MSSRGDPDRLQEVDGIGPVRAGRMHGRLSRAEGGPRDHGLPAQPRGRYGTGGAHLRGTAQDTTGTEREVCALARRQAAR
jgi:hypothetical protein